MLSASFDRCFLEEQGRQEGERRVRERMALAYQAATANIDFFPLPESWAGQGKVALVDESGYPFTVQNRAGEDTALVVARCSHVVALPDGHLCHGPLNDTVLYPGPISRLVGDLNTLCALTFGGRIPYRHADVAGFGEKVNVRKIYELVAKNSLWAQVRSLWTSGTVSAGDVVLLDGNLNVVQTPRTATVDEIDADLYDSGIILAGLSKSFGPKCEDIVALGRTLYPGQAFVFAIPPDRIRNAHSGADQNEMILTLGPKGRTLGLPFGIVLSTDPTDYTYHGLFVSYRHNPSHRQAVDAGEPVKVYQPIRLSPSFISDVLVPLGARLVQYSKGVVSPNYPLPAGAVHSHVLLTLDDLTRLLEPLISGMLEGGETLHYIEVDERQPHDVVDALLNRFFRR